MGLVQKVIADPTCSIPLSGRGEQRGAVETLLCFKNAKLFSFKQDFCVWWILIREKRNRRGHIARFLPLLHSYILYFTSYPRTEHFLFPGISRHALQNESSSQNVLTNPVLTAVVNFNCCWCEALGHL